MNNNQTNQVYTNGQKITVNGNNLYITNRNPRTRRTITIISVIVIIVLLILLCLKSCDCLEPYKEDQIISDENSVEWNGNQNIKNPHPKSYQGSYIPGFDVLNLVAGTTKQKVNFYNPEENNCYFKMSLYVENEKIWESGYVKPGTGFYNIEISRTFAPKETDGYLRIECYSMDEQIMTKGVNINIKIIIY